MLSQVFDQSSACPKNLPPWPLSVTDSVPLNETMHYSNHSAFSCQETASNVAEIVEGSRDKAQNMVDTAIKVRKGPAISVSLVSFYLLLWLILSPCYYQLP